MNVVIIRNEFTSFKGKCIARYFYILSFKTMIDIYLYIMNRFFNLFI
nr:MAG TPA: hypothetical protein [Caudoviricetes sp.]